MRTLLAALPLLLAASPAAAQDAPPPDSGRVYELAEVETPPRPVNVADLRAALDAGFPPERLANAAGGTVNVSFVVGADGAVRQARVVSSTDAAFDAPSLSALAVLRFSPATVGGTPVATRLELPIPWQAPAPVAQAEHAGEGVVSTVGMTEQGERIYTMSDVVVVGRTYEVSEVDHRPQPRSAPICATSRCGTVHPGWASGRPAPRSRCAFASTPTGPRRRSPSPAAPTRGTTRPASRCCATCASSPGSWMSRAWPCGWSFPSSGRAPYLSAADQSSTAARSQTRPNQRTTTASAQGLWPGTSELR